MDLLRRFGQFSSLLPFELVKSCQQVLFFWIWWADIWRVLFRRCKTTTDSRDVTYWSGLTGNSCQLVKFVANGKMFRSLLSPDILPLNSFWRAKLSGLVLLLKYEGSVWICTHSCLDPGLGESSTILQSLEPSELTKEGGRRRHGRVDHSPCRTKQEEKFRQKNTKFPTLSSCHQGFCCHINYSTVTNCSGDFWCLLLKPNVGWHQGRCHVFWWHQADWCPKEAICLLYTNPNVGVCVFLY